MAESPQPFKLGSDDVFFDRRLRRRIDMLIVAAAAGAEVPAARRHTVRGGLEDFEQPGPAPMRMGFHHLDGDALAGQCKGDEDHAAVCVAAEGIASVGHAFQPEL